MTDATRSASVAEGVPRAAPSHPGRAPRSGRKRARLDWRGLLPTGAALPDAVWVGRHRALSALLWVHVGLLTVIAFVSGHAISHSLLEVAAVAVLAACAGIRRLGRNIRADVIATGLIVSSMILVHSFDGLIEMHFHFFVMILVISLYQSWQPLLIALVLIVVHHGLGEAVLGLHVYDHPAADSWFWALVHGAFVLAQVVVALLFWRSIEAAQVGERRAHIALSEARETVIADELTRAGARESVIAEELARAAEVQRALLPRLDVQLPGYQISGVCLPSRAVGGDFFDWYPVEGGLAFTLSDVMGKGAGAGIIAATARAVIRSARTVPDPVTALDRADKTLSTELGEGDSFATAFHARLHAVDGRVEYVDAGHGLTILVRANGSWERLASDDPPLGMSLVAQRTAKEAVLEPGDMIVAFSDGVLDLYGGTLRAVDQVALLAMSAGTADEVVASLRQVAMGQAAMGGSNPDDVTVLAIRRAE